ncbi:MAG: chorismate mutase [Coriobacteriia bacterium]|nr:chorismate mutase [Coriobacteriia bacterium]MCL2750203.1 chorismate mutase [Coriobacteriia bacterium]
MDINEIRNRIDAVDERILEAFIERMRLSEEVAEYKQRNALPLENIAREQEVLQKVKENSGKYGLYAQELFSTLIKLSKDQQQELFSELEGS